MNYESGAITQERLAGPDAPRSRAKWFVAAVAALVLGVAAWAIWGRDGGEAAGGQARTEQLPTVSVVVPGRTTVGRTVAATGSIAARREMPLSVAGEGGLVTRVLVEPGQWVNEGQVLAVVDRAVQQQTIASLAAQVSVARADAELAQAELDRARQLVDRGFISRADLQRRGATREAAIARVRVAQAQLGEARARTGRLDVRAPAAGLVLTRQVEPGQVVSSGSGVLFRMAQGGLMEMRAQLSETDLQGLRPGARATVIPVGSDQRFPGEVWQVSPVIDPQTRQGIARIALRYDPALRPGGFAAAEIVGGVSQLPVLPDSALQSDDRGSFVYVVDGAGKVQRRGVRIGQVSDAGVAIAEGLSGTERVVRSAGGFLSPGQKIKPIVQKAG